MLSALSLLVLFCLVYSIVLYTLHPSYISMPLGVLYGACVAYMVRSRAELKIARKAEEAVGTMAKSNVPIGVLALAQEAGQGNVSALAVLWQQLYGETLDPSRPVDQVVAECQVALQAQYGEDAEQ